MPQKNKVLINIDQLMDLIVLDLVYDFLLKEIVQYFSIDLQERIKVCY